MKCTKNLIWEPKCSQIGSQNGGALLNFLKSFSVPSSKLPPGGPRTPKIIRKSQKTQFLNHFFSCKSAFVAAYVLSSKENSRQKSLQQFSPCALLAGPWENKDGHAVPADCLGELFGGAAMIRRRRLR